MIVVGMHRHKSTTETAHYQEEDGDWRKRNCKTAGVWNEAGVSNCRGKWLSVSRVGASAAATTTAAAATTTTTTTTAVATAC